MATPKTKAEIVAWLKSRLAEKQPGKNQAQLAKALGKDRSAVTRILAGQQDITVDDYAVMRLFFGEAGLLPEPAERLQRKSIAGSVRMVGRVGDNTWTRMHEGPVDGPTIGAVTSEFPVEDQSGWELIEPTLDGQYHRGDVIFTVPFDIYRGRLVVDDIVVVRAMRGSLERYSLRRAVLIGFEVTLVALSPKTPSAVVGHDSETPIGLVIGFFRRHRLNP